MSVFDTIILLTGQIEQPILAAALFGNNPLLTIRSIATLSDLTALEPDLLWHARLLAFATGVIVPRHILGQLGFGAYNFHPGPPNFPGWAPAYFALYRNATEFGVTVHVMTERVDEGPIVGVEMFPIPEDITATGLEGLAYGHLARLFWQFARRLATQREPLPELPVRWSGEKTSRRMFNAIFKLPADVPEEELNRLVRVFGDRIVRHQNSQPNERAG